MTKPEEERPLYSSKIIITYLCLIKKRYGYVDIPELLRYAGMKPYEVEDDGHWFTQTQVDRFYERLEALTGDPGLAREAGRFNASPEGFGEVARYVFGLAGPARVFETIGKLSSNFTRSARYESRRLGPTEIELTVHPIEGISEKPYQCENRMGTSRPSSPALTTGCRGSSTANACSGAGRSADTASPGSSRGRPRGRWRATSSPAS